jgi:hypothetical protein
MLQPAYGQMRPWISASAVSVKRPLPQLVTDCQEAACKGGLSFRQPHALRDSNDELIQLPPFV